MSLKESKAEQLIGIVSVVFGLLLIVLIIPTQINLAKNTPWYNQPRFFPYVISGIFILMGVLLYLSGVKKKGRTDQDTYSVELQGGKMVLITLGLVFLYVLSLSFLPYIPCTVVGLGILMWLFGQRDLKKLIPVSVLLPVLIYFSFTYLLKLKLP